MKRLTIYFVIISGLCNAQVSTPNFNYSQNLLSNGDAEIDALNRKIISWNSLPKSTSNDYLQNSYGETLGEWEANCDEKCGLPPNAGTNYFRLPTDDSYKNFSLYQTVDLSGFKDSLEACIINFDLTAYIAGINCSESGCAHGTLSVIFKDINGKQTGTYEMTKDNNEFKDIGSNYAMHKFEGISISNLVPEKTNSAEIWLKAAGGCCDLASIFFDNVSFVLSKGEKRK